CIWPAISSIRIRGLFQRTKVHKPLSQNMRQTSLKDANPEGPVTDIPKIIHSRKNSDKKGLDVKGQGHSKFQMSPITGDFSLPPLTLLNDPPEENEEIDREIYLSNARLLEKKLLDFGVAGNVVEICPGPVVTMYEYSPAPGIKINKVASLADDLALALRTHSVRIVAPIPGKAVIGIELANTTRHIIYLKEILSSNIFQKTGGRLLLTLGQDIVGQPVVTDLTKMPHLLIAGATGTGKSVGLNALICSLLYGHHPDRLRFLMIDPKRIELSLYDGIPHLLHPVVSEPKEATRALRWAVMEMERRYKLLEEAQARNLQGYNKTAEEPLPYLIIVIDELADLMIVSSKEVESAITRLAQMARAAGIHLIVATQRPSVDVLTGLIKANFPARISFKVSSKVDSRTILDIMGAERLLGMGDMLFLPPGSSALKRIHGAYVSEKEIVRVVEFLKAQGEPDYDQTVIEPIPGEEDSETSGPDGESVDVKYDEAVEIVTQTGQASISMLQRRLRVGYNRSARMIEQMEHAGVVSPTDNMGRRHVLVRKYE
ncbi:MAG: cell division protein FtsK, partial [Deltaproteobacteria bacterium]|nr:cell division protein FtsK [Deltaproteobacteria bacterium]